MGRSDTWRFVGDSIVRWIAIISTEDCTCISACVNPGSVAAINAKDQVGHTVASVAAGSQSVGVAPPPWRPPVVPGQCPGPTPAAATPGGTGVLGMWVRDPDAG